MSTLENNDAHRRLVNRGKRLFPNARSFQICRAPGRINLIGEHTDYNGLPVLPFALPRAVTIAFAPQDDGRVTLFNVNERFGPVDFAAGTEIERGPAGSWENYIKAAVQDIAHLLEEQGLRTIRGFRGVVDSTIPPSGGLSSSSALVVAAGLCLLHANSVSVDRLALAERFAEAEKYVGTRGGGMDQAACLFGKKGSALLINFFPLRPEQVPFPEDYGVLACHSLVHADKAGAARNAFNERVHDCTKGVKLLESGFSWYEGACLRDFAEKFGIEATITCLEEQAGKKSRIEKRCRYVLQEGARVEKAAHALKQGDMQRLGELMNQSHTEAAELYEISCRELDELVAIGRKEGAIGARLTGAGFGGFAIMLGKRSALPAIRTAIDRAYYAKNRPEDDPALYRFIFSPADGASVGALND